MIPRSPARRDCTHPIARHEHGTLGAYQRDACRCFPCRLAAARAYQARHFADDILVSSIGVQRRLQALAAIGWGSIPLGKRLGVSSVAVDHWRSGRYPTVRPETAAKVAELYEELWDEPVPRHRAVHAQAAARRHGWLPPLAWDDIDRDPEPPKGEPVGLDEIAIERVIAGDDVPLTKAERLEAARIMIARGKNNTEIGERLGITNSGAYYLQRRHLAETG